MSTNMIAQLDLFMVPFVLQCENDYYIGPVLVNVSEAEILKINNRVAAMVEIKRISIKRLLRVINRR